MPQLQTPNFNSIARPYRWLEYLTLGPALQSCRTHFLPQLKDRNRAIVLGDGDGRFLAALLAQNPALTAEAVDASPIMLQLLRQRCQPHAARLQTHQQDIRTFTPTTPADLIATHFFLDCLTQPEVEALAARIAPTLAPGALWLVSDFRIPAGLMRLPAKALVRSLYLAFRVLTNLRATSLPKHEAALAAVGLTRIQQHMSLGGLLFTELWLKSSTINTAR